MQMLGRGILLGLLGLLATASPVPADTPAELTERLRKATSVLSGLASGKQDTDIPREVLARARAVAVFPQVKKGAVIVGGRHGQGAGASFEGATVQPDGSAIRTLYGAGADSREVLLGTRYAVPASGRAFVNVLATYSPPPKKR